MKSFSKNLVCSLGHLLFHIVVVHLKTYRDPKSESWQFFLIDTFGGLLSLLAVRMFVPEQFSYPLYIMLINFAVVVLVWRKPAS